LDFTCNLILIIRAAASHCRGRKFHFLLYPFDKTAFRLLCQRNVTTCLKRLYPTLKIWHRYNSHEFLRQNKPQKLQIFADALANLLCHFRCPKRWNFKSLSLWSTMLRFGSSYFLFVKQDWIFIVHQSSLLTDQYKNVKYLMPLFYFI